MASYLGDISVVADMINNKHIHPDLADVQGNTALMYATVSLRRQKKIFLYLIDLSRLDSSANAIIPPHFRSD